MHGVKTTRSQEASPPGLAIELRRAVACPCETAKEKRAQQEDRCGWDPWPGILRPSCVWASTGQSVGLGDQAVSVRSSVPVAAGPPPYRRRDTSELGWRLAGEQSSSDRSARSAVAALAGSE